MNVLVRAPGGSAVQACVDRIDGLYRGLGRLSGREMRAVYRGLRGDPLQARLRRGKLVPGATMLNLERRLLTVLLGRRGSKEC